ncbi:MAG: type II secretion system protein [Phycisphaerales bacterium]|nr:type II secretion system protein [Phycisphaerales bacterium]
MPKHSSQPDRSSQSQARRAFTLLELVVVFAIIVLVISFLASALGRATISARQTASQRSAEAIAAAVEQFQLEFGFLPPLVHDGEIVSSNSIRPIDPLTNSVSADEGPLKDGVVNAGYNYKTLVVWSESADFDFLRRRDGSASDEVDLPSGGGPWNIDTAWDDRRYSRYALAYYLTGMLPRSVDGVAGEGMTRPLINGGFANVGYPVGSTRDRYGATIDINRRGVRVEHAYARPIEIAEHDASVDYTTLTAQSVYDLYPADAQDSLIALVDAFGTAFRYYRWEHGRYNDRRQLITEDSLDLNIPPVLLDPEAMIEVENNDDYSPMPDLTEGDLKIRQARYAIVGAGADRLFGTEPIEYLVEQLGERDPAGDPAEIARIRKVAMFDNVVALGK